MKDRLATALAVVFATIVGMSFPAGPGGEALAAGAEVMDLLAIAHPDKSSEAGDWKLERGQLRVSTGSPARVVVPIISKGAYSVEVVFDRPSGGDAFGVYLAIGRSCVAVLIRTEQIGLDLVDGQRFDVNRTAARGDFGSGAEHTVLAHVEPEGERVTIDVSVDGKKRFRGREPGLNAV